MKEMIPPGFILFPHKLITIPELKPSDYLVYGIVYWLTRLKGGKCFASNRTIAKLILKNPGTIANSLTRLERAECIVRVFHDDARRERQEIIPLLSLEGESLSLDDETIPLIDEEGDSLSSEHNNSNSKKSRKKEHRNNTDVNSKSYRSTACKGKRKKSDPSVISLSDHLKERQKITSLDKPDSVNEASGRELLDKAMAQGGVSESEALQQLRDLIDVVVQDDFHSGKAMSLVYINNNYQLLRNHAELLLDTSQKYQEYSI